MNTLLSERKRSACNCDAVKKIDEMKGKLY